MISDRESDSEGRVLEIGARLASLELELLWFLVKDSQTIMDREPPWAQNPAAG